MTTPAKQFGDWLKTAMRRAGLDVDSQMGGGRAAFADAVGVSRSTVKRWLDGTTLPEPTKFEPIANELGVPVMTMLVETGIVSVAQVHPLDRSEPTPEEAFAALGITDPDDMAVVRAMIDRMRELRHEQARQREAEPPRSRAHVQRGVGGHPRAHTLKADEPEE